MSLQNLQPLLNTLMLAGYSTLKFFTHDMHNSGVK
jgi:hypothetical protein